MTVDEARERIAREAYSEAPGRADRILAAVASLFTDEQVEALRSASRACDMPDGLECSRVAQRLAALRALAAPEPPQPEGREP